MSNNTLGEIIRSLRKRAHITQEELAEGICSPISVSRIENGTQMPSNSVLEALLSRLGTSTYQICNIYYQTDKQIAFNQEADRVAELLSSGQLPEAKDKLAALEKAANNDSVNMQYYLLLSATIKLYEETNMEKVLSILYKAIEITKPSFDFLDFRNELLTVREANILNVITAALFRSNETIRAIHLGEELFCSLKKHVSTISGYNLLRINVAFNLAQYMEKEYRYKEALMYCQEAESLSMSSQEQMLLPEIQFIKAKILHLQGNDAESHTILKAIIPYMELVKKAEFAALARNFAEKELNLFIPASNEENNHACMDI
ncbi:MAG: helix-turn-helix transcriptional regulator [Butyrivibrio sp.]|nr:helix-turn-helix transcriptional regulator [Acetatifactor muris]MCM1559902.1 helix-turn-helix transcriptional regulator [Butyrivibrio sp.]